MDNSTSVPLVTTEQPPLLDHSEMPQDHLKMNHKMPMPEETIIYGQTAETSSMILSCLVVVLLCFVMKAARWARMKREETRTSSRSSARDGRITSRHLPDVILHCLQLTCSYLLMLVFMRCDVCLCAATVAGEVIARLFFASYLPIVSLKKISFNDTQ
ncbi:hypothetical protein PRIPAC_91926 [Pristionchus pacificus]|uniref:Copper transport protein n=1 Tax=Pristionchus pacificus TaxID=54126 RepID=A0A2A6CDT4_PRIPA|nr:hypothetical protein PRIPAC_91926 [Pristionchus pacificus]|eukprot:PDM76364.1 hypothetical protein PRIPAC_39968 [Pristionchus pacificus]